MEGLITTSLGCGDPLSLAHLNPGETVLDLGSGVGVEAILASRLVGENGYVYGIDMTEEMITTAEENLRRSGASNVEFIKADIEAIPLPDASIDVILSNCVVNLVSDKSRALREAFRVLKPGGRLAISDMVWLTPPPNWVTEHSELWNSCIGGALTVDQYRDTLLDAGFSEVCVNTQRVYDASVLGLAILPDDADLRAEAMGLKLASAAVTACKR